MKTQTEDLWNLIRARPRIDPRELAEALNAQAGCEPLDYRTRLLIHDSLEALRQHWGEDTLTTWLAACPFRDKIEAIRQERFDERGFPSLGGRIMQRTDPEDVHEYLRSIGSRAHQKLQICVGGSVALILVGYLSRGTEDIDVVDEVPAELRNQHALLEQLERRYGLRLAHFASHYLPQGWEQRVLSVGAFGSVEVSLVDVYDVFLSKLFSARQKDLDDLHELKPKLDKETLERRLRTTTAALRSDLKLRGHAEENWYILYGESFPP